MSELSKEEYQAAYDAEMAKLSGEAEKSTTKPNDEPVKEPEAKIEEPAKEPEIDVKKLAEEVEKAKKALADTQRWGHQNAAEVKRLKRELEEKERAAQKPDILNSNPGLEDAIRYVNGPSKPPQQVWMETVSTALPDIEDLLSDESFNAKALAKRQEMAGLWDDPIAATRELGNLRLAHIREKAVAEAVEKARKDFEAKQKKQAAMHMPSGSSSSPPKEIDEAERIRTMSSAEFAKMRNKTLGFNG